MMWAKIKAWHNARYIILIGLCLSIIACAGHNTEKRLSELENNTSDQKLLDLRVNKLENRILLVEDELIQTRGYIVPAGAKWIEPNDSANQRPINTVDTSNLASEASPSVSNSNFDDKSTPSLKSPIRSDYTPAASKNTSSNNKSTNSSNTGSLNPKYVTGVNSYDKALAKYYRREHKSAAKDFANFRENNPNNKLVPNAIYWEAECFYAQRDLVTAILNFKNVVTQFPKHSKAADALLKIGMSYQLLNDSENARFYWEILIDDFPKSASAQSAKARLTQI